MAIDLSHRWGADLEVGPTGDLAVATDAVALSQRIIRRLLTNPGDYIWKLDYGAGLGGFLGSPATHESVEAVIRTQVLQETAVARYPEPSITMSPPIKGLLGTYSATIQYWEQSMTKPNALTVLLPG